MGREMGWEGNDDGRAIETVMEFGDGRKTGLGKCR